MMAAPSEAYWQRLQRVSLMQRGSMVGCDALGQLVIFIAVWFRGPDRSDKF